MNAAVWAVRAACVGGIWFACLHALADGKARAGDEAGLRGAIAARPNHFLYYWLLGRSAAPDSQALLRRAAELNPYHSFAKVDLALLLEQEGKTVEAEQMLNDAIRVDRTYYPLWSMANFSLRRGRDDEFWKWTRRALEFANQDVGAMIGLCYRLEPDPEALYRRAIPERSVPLRYFIEATRNRKLPVPPAAVAALVKFRAPEDIAMARTMVDVFLQEGRGPEVERIWAEMVRAGTAPASVSSLAREFTPAAVDWSLVSHPSVYAARVAGALDLTLDGKQDEGLEVLRRFVPVKPGGLYEVRWKQTSGAAAAVRGMSWRVSDVRGGVIPPGGPLSEGPKQSKFRFTVPEAVSVVRLSLISVRPEGQMRASGNFGLSSVDVEPVAPGD